LLLFFIGIYGTSYSDKLFLCTEIVSIRNDLFKVLLHRRD